MSFVDLTATLRVPRAPDEESAAQLAAHAAAGGFSVVVVSARGVGPAAGVVDVESLAGLQLALDAAQASSGVRLVPALSPLVGDRDLADIASMLRALPAGAPRVLRLRSPIDDALLLRRVGDLARGKDALVVVAATDAALAHGGVVVEGAVATRLGLPSVPEASERIAISRIIEVAKLTGARFHVAGVFTAGGAALIAENAAAAGADVSGSVYASHLLFDEGALLAHRYDTRLLTKPPLPTSTSRAALLAAVQAGTLSVSSGHHFVPKRERDLEMTRATAGMTSLSSLASSLSTLLTPAQLTAALATAPARILKIDPPAQNPTKNSTTTTAPPADDLYRLRELVSGART